MNQRNKKKLIGITGGIGTGKSLFSDYLVENGFPVIYSDLLAKELITKNQNIKNEIIKNFGSKAFNKEGLYNAKYISDIVFSDHTQYTKLNSIVHPPVITEMFNKAKKLLKSGNLVFIESALIYESFMDEKLDFIILFKSDISLRIKRVIDRDKISPDDFFNRIQYQIDPDEAEKGADFTINNNSTIEELKPKFDFLINFFNVLTK